MAERVIYIMRHGKTEWNAAQKIQGRKDSPLLEESLKAAREIGVYLKNRDIQKVFTSPLGRARCTAETVCQYLGLPYQENDLLMECDHGSCEGMSLEQVREKMPGFFITRELDKWLVRWPGGESYSDISERAERFIATELSIQQNILIVGHEMINKCILGVLLHWGRTETMKFKQSNCELIRVSAGEMEVVCFK